MSEKYQLPSESDEDDEDYIPERQDSVSEVESEVDEELLDNENHEKQKETDFNDSRKHKKMKNKKNQQCKKRKEKIFSNEKIGPEETKPLGEEEEKKRADSLWADFMKDAAVVSKSKSANSTENNFSEKSDSSLTKQQPILEEKIKITKLFEFAGEKIAVEKEVLADSTEARLLASKSENFTRDVKNYPAIEKRKLNDSETRKVGLGGISSVLGHLGKKAKITTLEKSKMDWENFKKQENIEEEINTHNKGKAGYLEKQDFLERADFRQFEIEKKLRSTSRHNTR